MKFAMSLTVLAALALPPTGLAKLYNALTCPKEFHWMQGSQHGYVPPPYEGRDIIRKAD